MTQPLLSTYDGLCRVSESWLPAVGTTSSDFLAATEVQGLSNTTYGDSYAYSRNRMTFSQDGVQRTSGQWTYYLYDGLDRLTGKGVCPNKILTSKTAHIVNHYDGYSFVGTTGFSNTYYPSGDNNGIGNLTGSVITVFGSDLKIYRAHYYDAKGNVIKTVESNLMGGYDTTTTTYTFTDKPLTVTHAVTNGAINVYLTEVYTYTYDSLDRMVKVQHTLDDTTVTLAEYTYDNVGRMATKQLHGNSTTQLSYTYNVRGWLESIAGNKFNQHLYYTTGNGTACYNGNISSMTWEAGDESTLRGYKYTYDAMNRLTAGNYGEGSTLTSNTGRYTESVGQYDKNGNISAGFVRNGLLSTGSYGAMNALVMTLDGNHLQAVRDVSGSTAASGAFEFVDGVTQTTEYTYDNNGNLTQDLNKGITNISYNVLSLPSEVTFSDGSTVTYCYDAEGRKQKVTYNITGETAFHRTYSNGLLYENNVPKQLLTTEGYIDLTDSNSYYYYLKDHQGNNRVVVSSSGTVMETNHYYPFGGVFSTSNVQPYKYNGKELDTKNGLNWYDYGARHYDAALGRWFVVDPLAEKMYGWSPYGYCFNNPIKLVDIDGKYPGPGDLFVSKREAAKDWGKYYNGASIIRNREMVSIIYKVKDEGKIVGYSYSKAYEGGEHSASLKISLNKGDIAGLIHSHGASNEQFYDNKFSTTDIKSIEKANINGFLATPNGSLLEYNPMNNNTNIISKELPSDPKDKERVNNVDPTDIPAEIEKRKWSEQFRHKDIYVEKWKNEMIDWFIE